MTFPRFSVVGGLILTLYLTSIIYLFDMSLYGDSLRSDAMVPSSYSTFLNSFTAASSLLNVASHSGVVLGALNDTYVISILIGVGFDVMTRILQLIWWMDITWSSFFREALSTEMIDEMKLCSTVGFLAVLTTIYTYHMIIHVRALRLNASVERLNNVLIGALNNLRGIPGEHFNDHIFAYTDLGAHLLPLGLSVVLLKRRQELWAAFRALVFLITISYVALSRIPFNKLDSIPRIDESARGKVICSCSACERRTKRKSKDSSFTFNIHDGICILWLYSFENLSTNYLSSSLGKKLG
mmetsp:Transcript_51/g.66  ORF Transcript_51/g.66 Transcript_51/m.66 type:complete len:297 (+) Transcript_51:72-962(+)